MIKIFNIEIIFFLFLFLFLESKSLAQISPPGLGKTNMASWLALSLRQQLDSAKKVQSVSYIGMGRKSNPNDYNPYSKSAIWVFNQEFYHQFHPHWQYSLALSYRRQDEYADTIPYQASSPFCKQEFRIYGRYSYVLNITCVKMVLTFRQEFRKFYAPDFSEMEEIFQLRTRGRIQVTVNFDKNKIHKLIGTAEVLFATSKKQGVDYLTNFSYTESRFCLYYSFSPKNLPLVFNIGYMNNLVGKNTPYDAHYLALDIIVENPFNWKKRNKDFNML